MQRPSDYSNCPKCGKPARCRIVRERRPIDISLDGPSQTVLLVGVYRCKECKKYFTVQPEGLVKRHRYTDRAKKKVYDGVIKDKLTFLGAPRRVQRDFSIGPSVSTCWRWVQKKAGAIDLMKDYCQHVAAQFSGQLSVDEVVDGKGKLKRRMFVATDPLQKSGPVIDYHRADHANVVELTKFLTHLRDDLNIQPKIVNHDDANIFPIAIGAVWPDAKLQLCHFHVIKNFLHAYMRKSLTARLRALPKPVNSEEKKLHTDINKDSATTLL